ncbi:hypothetical protein BO443_140177 [Burkholderia orbicola]
MHRAARAAWQEAPRGRPARAHRAACSCAGRRRFARATHGNARRERASTQARAGCGARRPHENRAARHASRPKSARWRGAARRPPVARRTARPAASRLPRAPPRPRQAAPLHRRAARMRRRPPPAMRRPHARPRHAGWAMRQGGERSPDRTSWTRAPVIVKSLASTAARERRAGARPERSVRGRRARSDLDHLEVFLAGAAFGTRPVDRDVFPARARGNALFRQPGFFVVNPATNQAHPALVFHLKPRRGKVGKFGSHDGTVSGPDCLAIALEDGAYVALR